MRCLFIEEYDVAVILTDENVVYLVDISIDNLSKTNKKEDEEKLSDTKELKNSKSICIKVYHFIAPKVRNLLKFN